MNRLFTLSTPFRQQFIRNVNCNLTKYNFSTTSNSLTRCLTALHSQVPANDGKHLHQRIEFFQLRNYSKKPPSSDDFERALDEHDSDDSEFEDGINEMFTKSNEKPNVPSVHSVPPYFPKIPVIASSFPVFPKFMKVFEVSGTFKRYVRSLSI